MATIAQRVKGLFSRVKRRAPGEKLEPETQAAFDASWAKNREAMETLGKL